MIPPTTLQEMLQNGLSSNPSFAVQLQSGPVTLEYKDDDGMCDTWSYSIVGQFYLNLYLS